MGSRPRRPFEQNTEIPQRKVGLKIDNQNSSVPVPQPDPVAVFNNQAKQAFDQNEDYKQRVWDLSSKFKSMVEDRTLSENRSIITKGVEKEILDKLVLVASEMNSDENQPDGLGSVALTMLIMKMMLIQRDTINSLLFKVDKLEKHNLKLEALLNELVKKSEK